MTKVFSFFLMFFLAASMQAQDAEASQQQKSDLGITADEIIAHYLENIGGVDNWQKIESITFAGTTLQGEMALPTTVYSMRPNYTKVVVDIMGKTYVDCTHGDEGWSINPFMGSPKPQKKSKEEIEQGMDEEFENPFINYAEKGYEVVLEGEEEIEGTPTYKVKLTKEDGKEMFYFFNQEYFVPLMLRTYVQEGEMEGMPVEVYFSDYEEVGDVVIAHSIEQRFNGQVVMQMTADNVILNDPNITVEIFAFPGEEE